MTITITATGVSAAVYTDAKANTDGASSAIENALVRHRREYGAVAITNIAVS